MPRPMIFGRLLTVRLPKEYHDAYSKQIKQFEENIYRQQIHLEMLYNFNEKIERAMNSQNIIKEITLEEPFWVYYPEMDECPGVRTAIFYQLLGKRVCDGKWYFKL